MTLYRFSASQAGNLLGRQATELGAALLWAARRSQDGDMIGQTVHVGRQMDDGSFQVEATFRGGVEVKAGTNPPPPPVEPLAGEREE